MNNVSWAIFLIAFPYLSYFFANAWYETQVIFIQFIATTITNLYLSG